MKTKPMNKAAFLAMIAKPKDGAKAAPKAPKADKAKAKPKTKGKK